MPEGDSIAKIAARLRPNLVGQTIRALRMRERGDVPQLVGSTVAEIRTHGKHMLVQIGDDWILRVHLGMHGRWRWAPLSRRDRYAREPASRNTKHAPSRSLLLQGVAAGIGNVYKSEALFLVGVDPRTQVAQVGDAQLRELFSTCRRLMKLNLLPGLRTTTSDTAVGVRRPPSVSRHWVYRRALPCFRCRTPIERALIGDQSRSTYWCPSCQPPI